MATSLQQVDALGGQSGTADDQLALICPGWGPLDRNMDWGGVPLSERLEQVFGSYSLSGPWLEASAPVPLELTLRDLGGGVYRPRGDSPGCEMALVPMALSAVVPGVFSLGPTRVEFAAPGPSTLSAGAIVTFDESAFARREQVPVSELQTGGELAIRVEWSPYPGVGPQISLAVRWADAYPAYFIVPPPRPPRHQPDPAAAAACERVELEEVPLAVTSTTVIDEAAALRALVGNWAICDYEVQLPYAGIQIRPDRTWSTIVTGDPLSLRSGFESEGALVFLHPMESGRSEFQGLPLGPAWTAPAVSVLPSASGDTIQGSLLLVRLTGPVAPAPAPTFARGERAGAAGCHSPETGFEPWFSDEASLQAALEGSWTICSGGNGSVRFSGHEVQLPTFEAPLTYEIYHHEGLLPDGHSRRLLVNQEEWFVSLSAQPRKLFIRRVRDGSEPPLESLVLSADP